ncbi:MAG: MBL fold metallo-hydrolase [Chlorobi bacterium]|nr:MAG: metallo-beta-lactamase [Chlorobi bacterium OLB7]MBK8910291.1 MBL fold metallo-hydrolase [Chlorobiota bacterium]MBX7217411.1 MBL fold metallo-hydrolase [Candidatus Kapabacteria bacterium]
MNIEQIYTGCLAQGAYYIHSNGVGAIIDPLREVEPYIRRAERDGVKIKYVFETHFHADFVSGHVDLARKTGATIVYGPNAAPEFPAHIATDGESFTVGEFTITALHTPGHTLESTCYLLRDGDGNEQALFTGDTLFLGDVGRPDLAQKAAHMTQEELAGLLYDSLMTKIMPLPNDLLIYPAHGAGSACGKNMMKETVDTLGHQKETNYALRQSSRQEFIAAVTDGLLPPPAYFPMNVMMNKRGYESIDIVMNHGMRPLNPKQFQELAEAGEALVLDTRPADQFAAGFIPRSVNIGLDGQFAPWVGALIADVRQPLLLVAEDGREEETAMRLARVGFDNLLGHLHGGFNAWRDAGKEVDTVHRVLPEEFAASVKLGEDQVIDVRRESEFQAQHLAQATNKPLDFINDWTAGMDPNGHFYLHCAGGYRSMMAASILKARGVHNFTEVSGGLAGISKTGLPVV